MTTLHISHPSNLPTPTSPLSNPTTLHLHLLQPLLDPTLLATTRHRTPIKSTTGPHNRQESYQYLRLAPLAATWREKWKSMSLENVAGVVFDLSVPELPPEDDAKEGMGAIGMQRAGKDCDGFWKDGEGCVVGVDQGDGEMLVVLLATVLKVRGGRGVQFEVMGEEFRCMERLGRHLRAFSDTKAREE